MLNGDAFLDRRGAEREREKMQARCWRKIRRKEHSARAGGPLLPV